MSIKTNLCYIRCDWRGCDQFLEYESDFPPTEQDIEDHVAKHDWEHVDSVTDYCEGCRELWAKQLAQDLSTDNQIDEMRA